MENQSLTICYLKTTQYVISISLLIYIGRHSSHTSIMFFLQEARLMHRTTVHQSTTNKRLLVCSSPKLDIYNTIPTYLRLVNYHRIRSGKILRDLGQEWQCILNSTEILHLWTLQNMATCEKSYCSSLDGRRVHDAHPY